MRAILHSLFPTVWLSLSCLVMHAAAAVVLSNETSPMYFFKSRPDLRAPILNIFISRPELLSPGYFFLAPYRNAAPGPYIYDNYGDLVWAGAGSSGPKTAHIPHICQYKDEDHLCYYQGEQSRGHARGYGVIMDKSYRTVKIVESAGVGISADMHEFHLTPYSKGRTAIVTVYRQRLVDLLVNPKFNLEEGAGWLYEGTFQDLDVETGELLFEWRSLDHVDPSVALVAPGSTDIIGDALTSGTAWDYFHINSVDKNRDGDYLISARHMSAIYKVSGDDGHIIWQLGGTLSSVKLQDFAFGYQHDARWVSENSTHTVLRFFDNANNGYNFTSPHSRALTVAINHITDTAHIIHSQGAPEPSGSLE